MSRPNARSMKPATAAKKLDVYLPATPAEFRESAITRDELAALQADPPAWLRELRKNGPHRKPRRRQARCVDLRSRPRRHHQALTTEQIDALIAEKPDWLVAERENYQNVLTEQRRIKALHAGMPEAHNGRAVETVRRAINASGGLGEPWCLDAGAAVPANGSPQDRAPVLRPQARGSGRARRGPESPHLAAGLVPRTRKRSRPGDPLACFFVNRRHNVQLTQPSTSVPSSAICRRRM